VRQHDVVRMMLVFLFLSYTKEIRHMVTNGGGAIVNLSSIAGLVGFPGLCPYVASKHGVIGLTKNAALEYAKQGIRVNAVCPGGIDTPMLDRLAGAMSAGNATSSEVLGPMHPMGRIGTPDECAALIVWLASSQASFVTGSAYPVDGGFISQ
jgi:NAD(P)-dependent dehydrogenase (short-subunit alcohol dehydrogenase family)